MENLVDLFSRHGLQVFFLLSRFLSKDEFGLAAKLLGGLVRTESPYACLCGSGVFRWFIGVGHDRSFFLD